MEDRVYKLEIKMLGEFDILVNDKSILNQLTRLPIIIELLQYMIAHYDKDLQSSIIADDIWPDKDYQDTNKVLRTYIYRLKRFLAGANTLSLDISEYIFVDNVRGRYKLVISEDVIFDIRLFDNQSKKVELMPDGAAKVNFIKEVIAIYKAISYKIFCITIGRSHSGVCTSTSIST